MGLPCRATDGLYSAVVRSESVNIASAEAERAVKSELQPMEA